MAGQADIDRKLYDAAKDGDIVSIEILFSKSPIPSVNSLHSWNLETALHAASRRKNVAVVRYLLDKGASLRVLNKFGRTAAHTACEWIPSDNNKGLATLQLLLDKDHSLINMQDMTQETCLHLAARRAEANLIQCLLDAGADATIKDVSQDAAWDAVANYIPSQASKIHYERAEDIFRAYRIFLRKEMQSGNIRRALNGMTYNRIKGLEVYQLKRANVVDIYILLEYLMYLKPLWQACQQIRGELCDSIKTGNDRRYREPSCTFETRNSQYCGNQDTIYREVCNESTFESFKALLSIQDVSVRPEAINFEVSESVLGKNVPNWESSKPLSGITDPISDHTGTKAPASDYLSIVMPLITVQTLAAMDRYREDLVGGFRYRRDKKEDLQGFHSPLTLDEYCYPALSKEILTRRNDDQTLTRFAKGKFRSDCPIIMVNQAWIWLSQDVLIYTFQGDASNFEMYPARYPQKYFQVGYFLANLMNSGPVNHILNTFQNSIVNLAEEVSTYIDRKGIESMTIEDEKGFYHEISDTREELAMLRRVLSQQEEVWREFVSNTWPDIWADCQDGRVRYPSGSPNHASDEDQKALMILIMQPRSQIQKSMQRISQLDEDAERVERSIAIQLDLKQKHASLQEAHATAVMSTAVFGFTIITIVFTPLSFVMSLFALPIDRFQTNQIPSRWTDEAGMYSSKYIGTWAATAELSSIALTFIAMWLALEYGLKYRVTLKSWNWLKAKAKSLYATYLLLPLNTRSFLRKQFSYRKSKDEESTAISTKIEATA